MLLRVAGNLRVRNLREKNVRVEIEFERRYAYLFAMGQSLRNLTKRIRQIVTHV